jgi:hypothetical protein
MRLSDSLGIVPHGSSPEFAVVYFRSTDRHSAVRDRRITDTAADVRLAPRSDSSRAPTCGARSFIFRVLVADRDL